MGQSDGDCGESGGGMLRGWKGKQTGSKNKGMGGVMTVANVAHLLWVILKIWHRRLRSKMSFINKIPFRT